MDDKAPRVRWVVISLALSILSSSLGISIVNVALPTLNQTFSVGFQQVQWVILAYILAITITVVSAGRLGDIVGARQGLLWGIAAYTIASLACGFASTLWFLIIARAVQGVGAALLLSQAMAIAPLAVSKQKIGHTMGLLATMSAIGTALGPALGGILIAGTAWQSVFLVLALLGGTNFILAYWSLPHYQAGLKMDWRNFDYVGLFLFGLTLAAYAFSVTIGGGQFGWVNLGLVLFAALCSTLFVLVQRHTTQPFIRLEMIRDADLGTSLIINVLVSTVMMATLVVGPFYLAKALELNNAFTGLIMSVGPIISTVCGIPSGRLVDRFGTSRTTMTGLAIMVIGSLALAIVPVNMGVPGYIVAIAILTPGYQLLLAANNTAVMMGAPAGQRGIVSGLLNLSRNIGFITGASVMAAVFAYASETTDFTTTTSAATAMGFRATFLTTTVLLIVALCIAVGRSAFVRACSTR